MIDHDYGFKPKTSEELNKYIAEKINKQHDYNTSAQALHDITVATFNYAASQLGNSGFQASYAALQFVGTVNGYDGPYGVLKGEDMLYPQYDSLVDTAAKWDKEWAQWAGEEAKKLLEEHEEGLVHPDVRSHWEELAAVLENK